MHVLVASGAFCERANARFQVNNHGIQNIDYAKIVYSECKHLNQRTENISKLFFMKIAENILTLIEVLGFSASKLECAFAVNETK